MTLSIPPNSRGPIVRLALPELTRAVNLVVRNVTLEKEMAIKLPEGWDGSDLTIDFFRKRVIDDDLEDRSGLLDPGNIDLWVAGVALRGGDAVTIKAEEVQRQYVPLPTGIAAVAADAAHLFWADSARTSVHRSGLDGSEAKSELVTGATNISDLKSDGTHVYWCNEGTTIGRATVAGTGVNQSFIDPPGKPVRIAVGATHIYWLDSELHTVGWAALDGSGVNGSLISAVSALSLAVDGSHVFWGASGAIGRANLDGSGVQKEFVPTPAFFALGIDTSATHIYWTVNGLIDGEVNGYVRRAKIDGSEIETHFIEAGAGAAKRLAATGDYLYWENAIGAAIARALINPQSPILATMEWEKGYF